MMRILSETNGRPQTTPPTQTGPFRDRLIQARAGLVTAVLAGQNCYVQGNDAPSRYRLITDTALRLTELNQLVAYFDLSDLAYQYNLATWTQNNIRLLAIQLNLPLPTANWWAKHGEADPGAVFVQFLGEHVLSQVNKPVILSFDEVDQLLRAPLAANFWRLVTEIGTARAQKPEFQKLTLILWGKASWSMLVGNGRFTSNTFKQIIL
jgi:hypothetical protein